MSLVKKVFRTLVFSISNIENAVFTGKAAGVVFSRPTIPESEVAIIVTKTNGKKVKSRVYINNGLEEYVRVVSVETLKKHYVEGRLDFV